MQGQESRADAEASIFRIHKTTSTTVKIPIRDVGTNTALEPRIE
jgi:hypothetical protein